MGGRETDDDDTHERHTDTNKLTRHTASWLPQKERKKENFLGFSLQTCTFARQTNNFAAHAWPNRRWQRARARFNGGYRTGRAAENDSSSGGGRQGGRGADVARQGRAG